MNIQYSIVNFPAAARGLGTITAVAILAFLLVPGPAALGQATGPKRTCTEKVLAELEKEELPDSAVASPDARRIAWKVPSGEGFAVVLDGKKGIEHRLVFDLAFSPDGKRFAYVAMRNGERKIALVVDGIQGKGYDGFHKDNRYFSPHGKPEGSWDDIGKDSLVFAPDGKRWACGAFRGGKSGLVLDGKEDFRGDGKHGVQVRFTRDGKKLYWAYQIGEKAVVVADGTESKPWDRIGDEIVLGPGDRHFAYAAKSEGKWTVVVDGAPGTSYDFIVAFREKYKGGGIVFDSPGSFHYLARHGKQVLLVEERIG
jgi:hypothetical protein